MKLHNHPSLEAKARQMGCLDDAHVIVDKADWIVQSRPTVTLSRRNLLSLLYKLEIGGHRNLLKPNGIVVTVEPDEVHYAERVPGAVNPDTEAFIRQLEIALMLSSRLRVIDQVLAEANVCSLCRANCCRGSKPESRQ